MCHLPLGSPCPAETEIWVTEEKEISTRLVELVKNVAIRVCWSYIIFSVVMPAQSAMILHPDASKRQQCADDMIAIKKAVLAAIEFQGKHAGRIQKLMERLLQDISFHNMGIVRIIWALLEDGRGWVSEHLTEFCRRLHGGPFSTKYTLEDAFASLKDYVTRSNKNLKSTLQTMWYVLALAKSQKG